MKTLESIASRTTPEPLAIIEAVVNTRYGRVHADEWATPTQLRDWLLRHQLLANETPLTRGDQRRMIEAREALRGLLSSNNAMPLAAEHIETLNHIARHAPVVVHFRQDGLAAGLGPRRGQQVVALALRIGRPRIFRQQENHGSRHRNHKSVHEALPLRNRDECRANTIFCNQFCKSAGRFRPGQ